MGNELVSAILTQLIVILFIISVKGNLFPIHFVDDTKAAFNLLDLMIGTPVMMVDRANFVQHIFEFVDLDVSYKELYNRLEV